MRSTASMRGPMSGQISAHTSRAGPAQRPRVLRAQRVAAVGVVAEERQVRAPRHPHREPRREQDARPTVAQALRPAGRAARAAWPPSRPRARSRPTSPPPAKTSPARASPNATSRSAQSASQPSQPGQPSLQQARWPALLIGRPAASPPLRQPDPDARERQEVTNVSVRRR